MQALDYGAIGVCVPHIHSAADARRAVSYVKYGPEGVRGMCPHIRATEYGGRADWGNYWRVANEETALIAIVEDVEGLENLEEIAAVPGVDALWLGGGDLSQSRQSLDSSPIDFEATFVKAAQQRTLELAQKNSKACLFNLPVRNSAARIAEWYAHGYRFFLWPDTAVFTEAVRDLVDGAQSAVATAEQRGTQLPDRTPVQQGRA
jgi:2-keto-3-deoxy-L-rhamnonate aldolase RhmA